MTLTLNQEALAASVGAADAKECLDDLAHLGLDLDGYTPGENGQEEPAESWVNAMGGAAVARDLGVVFLDADGLPSDDYCGALDVYNRAYCEVFAHARAALARAP
jgi:hypothetical protein